MAIEFMYLQCTWQWAMPGTSCLVVDSTHPSVMRMPQSLLPFQFHSVVVNRAISWQRWSNRGIPRRPVEHSTYASGMIHWILATAFSFSGSMVRISSILEFGCSLIIGQSRGRTMSLDDGSLPHQIHHLWQRKRSKMLLYIVWTILPNVIAVFVPNFKGLILVSLQSSLPFLDAR